MSNHYHLAIETPEPNLVAGMKWLQSTFATRFNRFRDERGHVFQGRYKAILLEENRPLSGLIDYIHLNPVRAGLCGGESLKDYGLSSYPKYCRGWFLGSAGARKDLAKELAKQDRNVQWEGKAFREIASEQWEQIVQEEMSSVGKDDEMVRSERKGADWKVEIARRLRRETPASNPWIAKRLNMGHPSRVSNLINDRTFKFYV